MPKIKIWKYSNHLLHFYYDNSRLDSLYLQIYNLFYFFSRLKYGKQRYPTIRKNSFLLINSEYPRSETEVRAYSDSALINARIVPVSKSPDILEPDESENIIDACAYLHIRSFSHCQCVAQFRKRENIRTICRIIFLAEMPHKPFETKYFSKLKLLD